MSIEWNSSQSKPYFMCYLLCQVKSEKKVYIGILKMNKLILWQNEIKIIILRLC